MQKSMDLDQINTMLMDLEPEQLIQIRNRINFLLQDVELDKVNDTIYSFVYRIASEFLFEKYGSKIRPFSSWKRSPRFNGYKNSVDNIEAYLNMYLPLLTKTHRVGFYKIMFSALFEYLERRNRAKPKTQEVVANLDLFQVAIESAFPGYRQAGLLSLVCMRL